MTERELSTLLERSTCRLDPDIDALVAEGGRRGRRRLRRTQAAVGVALTAAVIVSTMLPAVLGGSEDGGQVEPAAPPTSATVTSTPPGPEDPRDRVAPATAERRLIDALPHGEVEPVTAEPASWDPGGLSIYLRFEGADVFVRMDLLTDGTPSSATYSPREACADPDGAPCRQAADGSWISRRFHEQLWGVPGPYGHAVTRYTTDGWEIEVQAYDSTGLQSDDFRQVSSRPVLTPRQVEAIAASDRWFE